MERLFSPCTRLHDTLESQGRLERLQGRREGLQEQNLDVSTEELLSAERAFTYADLYAMLGNADTVAWLTPHAAVARPGGRVLDYWKQLDEDESYRFSFHADGKDIETLAFSPEHILEIFDVVLRLLAASVVHSVILEIWNVRDIALFNAASLANLMEHCQSLKSLSLKDLEMDENHCLVLGENSRPDLEIVLISCNFTSAGTSALAEVLRRNQGPTKLYYGHTDNFVLADGLRGNSRLKILTLSLSSDCDVGNQEVLAIAGALKENKGLVDLVLVTYYGYRVSEETWGAVCDSLKTHPTLEVLNICATNRSGVAPLATAVLKSRMQALVDMLKVNMSIHTLRLHESLSQHEIYRELVILYLQTNRFRPRLLAIQKTRPIPYRAKVLGRALLSARTDANSFWMLLSGNPEVAFPSTTATTTPAVNLPTPAIADATSNAATAAVTVTATWAASTAGASAVANVATPSTACQKRKTCP
jgi:hypothetical protein